MAFYSLADCLDQQGETEEARRRVADCRRAALSRADEYGKILLRMVEIRFPNSKRNHRIFSGDKATQL
jgi:hypothetical protein